MLGPPRVLERNFAGKSLFIIHAKIYSENAADQEREPAQAKCAWTCNKSNFTREFAGKMSRPKNRTTSLCEPVQPMRIMPRPKNAQVAPACAIDMHMDISQEPLYARIYRKNDAAHFMRNFTRKNPGAQSKEKSLRRLCASMRNRNSH